MPDTDAHTVTHARSGDIGLRVPRRWKPRRPPWMTLVVISAGGTAGAIARYAISTAIPSSSFPWATILINVAGCLLIGMVMVAIGEVWRSHRLIGPFLSIGTLGGFTTFSTYIVDVQGAVQAGAARTGLIYLVATPAGALAAVYVGMRLMRRLGRALTHRQERSRA